MVGELVERYDVVDKEADQCRVLSPARVAIYDDLLSSPRVIDIQPSETREFIGDLASTVYKEAKDEGGTIPYSIILQVTENFIHARFTEMIVSILDDGNTIRFTDQGPGIQDKESAQLPGYSSATHEMKKYIHGVGSGLPIVKEYLETKQGTIQIEDNLVTGAVITISLVHEKENEVDHTEGLPSSHKEPTPLNAEVLIPMLSKRAKEFLPLFKTQSIWGVKDLYTITNIPSGSMYNELKKLRDLGIVTQIGKKYTLTPLGESLLPLL